MANLFCSLFPSSILLCGLSRIGSSVEMLFIMLAIAGLFVLGIVVTLGFVCWRHFRPQDSEHLSIFRDAR